MKATINYLEIASIALNRYNKDIDISKILEKTFKICYNPGMMAPNIIGNVSIANISNNVIDLKYECCAEYSMLGGVRFSGMIDFVNKNILSIQKYIPEGIEVNTNERIVKVHLSKFEKLEKALEIVTLSGISFADNAINISLTIA